MTDDDTMWSCTNRRGAPRVRVLALAGALVLVPACSGPTHVQPAPARDVVPTGSVRSTQSTPPSAPAPSSTADAVPAPDAPWHVGITATVFWVGEAASSDNGGIANGASAWDDEWVAHYGGVDDPDASGNGGLRFTPRENPFYVALPYNDFAEGGVRKADASRPVPWAGARAWPADESMVKNRWVDVRVGDVHVFAQWEDVGPYLEDDRAYVFGTARPANRIDSGAGIDLSPAVRDALGVGDVSTVDWRFVDRASVAAGPWTAVVTTTQITWR
jgi:hypothetical protein